MNQESGTQVGILIELGSPFNTTDPTTNTEQCPINGRSNSEIMPEKNDESGEKKDEENEEETECVNEESKTNWDLKWSEDIPLVENEQFDFDLSLSPNCANEEDSNDDEDEVFFGPVNHREKCVLAHTEIDSVKPLSPLTNEQYAELFKEAIGLVMDLQQDDETTSKQKKTSGETEEFICKTLETLKLSNNYDSSPETTVAQGNKTTITESKCFKREQKKEIRSPRRQTYTISNNTNGITGLPKASECVSKLKPSGSVVFKAKGSVQRNVQKPPIRNKNLKGNLLPNKQAVPKKKQELSKQMVSRHTLRTSPPKRTRKNSLYSDDGISDTSSIMSDVSEASTSSIPVPGRKRCLPIPKLKKSGLAVPTNIAGENGNITKAPLNKPTLMKPGSFQRRTLTVNRSVKAESASKGQHQQPLKATMSLKSTKKTTPVSKVHSGANDRGRTPQAHMSATKCSQVKKCTPRITLPSTPVFQERRGVVPKRIMSLSSSKTESIQKSKLTSYSPVKIKATPSTPSISNHRKFSVPTPTASSRRRSGIPTPMKSSSKSRIFTEQSASPVSTHVVEEKVEISSSVASADGRTQSLKTTVEPSPAKVPVMEKLVETPTRTASGDANAAKCVKSMVKPSPAKTSVMEKVAEKRVETPTRVASVDARTRTKCVKSTVKPSPAKTPVLIDLNDSKTSVASPKMANLINFGDTPDTKDPMINLPVSEKENLLIVI